MTATAESLTTPPELKARTEEVQALQLRSSELAITDDYAIDTDEEYDRCGEQMITDAAFVKEVDEQRFEITRPMDRSKKRLMDFFDRIKAGPEKALNIRKRAMVKYKQEQDRIAREKQREVDEAARKERARLEEQARIADEANRPARAANLEERAAERVAPLVPAAPKVKGVSFRKIWRFRITDASKLPRLYMMPDTQKIGGQVKALKADADIPGIEVYYDEIPAARTR